ncbi:hypothetical protein DFP72DRAFT_1172588 [Ephemerocybe angulata]|uniref:Uncharacterized protein n=1 Tax=Ephemerocybe angulata TaxID=980116 RepID=A0A8H6HR77_9AGAR|nr:hypothetical protein DFP72DRAFT_1172588 [Tulosesus angulatus]
MSIPPAKFTFQTTTLLSIRHFDSTIYPEAQSLTLACLLLSTFGVSNGIHKPAQNGFSPCAIHVGSSPNPSTGAVIPSTLLSTTYAQSAPGVHKGYEYNPLTTPTKTPWRVCSRASRLADSRDSPLRLDVPRQASSSRLWAMELTFSPLTTCAPVPSSDF